MEMIAWNESEIDKLEVGQKRVARMALNAPRYASVEALRDDMGWSRFRAGVPNRGCELTFSNYTDTLFNVFTSFVITVFLFCSCFSCHSKTSLNKFVAQI